MFRVDTKAPQEPNVKRLSVKDHVNGVVTSRDVGRTGLRGLASTTNTMLTQDSVIRPRPSTVRAGPQPTGKVLGEIFEFKKVVNGVGENWLMCMQSFNVSRSPSASASPSASGSPSSSPSPSSSDSPSLSISPSASVSPSASASSSASPSKSPSASASVSASVSASPSPSPAFTPASAYAVLCVARYEDENWTQVTGTKYYDPTARVHYLQSGSKVGIMNGVDHFSYYNISAGTITAMTPIGNPSAPTLTTNTGLVGSDFTIYYRITANSTAGESAASNALAQPVSKDRDTWDPDNNSIKISWSAVTGAESYNVYMGTVGGFEFRIASGVEGLTFTDNGTLVQDNTSLFPTTNNTAGPKCARGTVINGRVFMLADPNDPYKVWNGGDPGFELDFSPTNGGNYSMVNSGGKEIPMTIKLHRDGKGTAAIKVYCSGTKGKRFTMTPDQLTFENQVIPFYAITEDENESGTNSPDGILYYNNSMHYPSTEGFEVDGTLPSIQNVLTTKKASNTIQDRIATLNQEAMDGVCSMVMEGRLLWGLPVNSDSNNQIWALDAERKGAWMLPWDIAAEWMVRITDNSGNVHHLVLVDNGIYDLSYTAFSSDDGEGFTTSGMSGQIYFSEDKRMWVHLLKIIVVVLRPQGEIIFSATGRTEDESVQALGEPTPLETTAGTSVVGWGETNTGILGWGRNAWSKIRGVPTVVNESTVDVSIDVDQEVQWASYSWLSTQVGVDYGISDVIFEYVETGIKDLQ